MHRYVNECAFRVNEGSGQNPIMDRINATLDHSVGKRLTYQELTADPLLAARTTR